MERLFNLEGPIVSLCLLVMLCMHLKLVFSFYGDPMALQCFFCHLWSHFDPSMYTCESYSMSHNNETVFDLDHLVDSLNIDVRCSHVHPSYDVLFHYTSLFEWLPSAEKVPTEKRENLSVHDASGQLWQRETAIYWCLDLLEDVASCYYVKLKSLNSSNPP